MICNEIIVVILIIFIIITINIQIFATDLQFNIPYDFKNNLKGLYQKDEIYPLKATNLNDFKSGSKVDTSPYRIKDEYELQLLDKKELLNKQTDYYLHQQRLKELFENSYKNLHLDYKEHNYDLIPRKFTYITGPKYRREVYSNVNITNFDNASLYPSVLTNALKITLNATAPTKSGESLLTNVAQQMNTTTLDLAKNLANIKTTKNDDLLEKLVKTDLQNPIKSGAKHQNLEEESGSQGPQLKNDERLEDTTISSLAEILERLLNKLESMYDVKNGDVEDHADGSKLNFIMVLNNYFSYSSGAPCDIIGSWSSTTLGLCFDIQLRKEKICDISPAEINNKLLSINVAECTPPKNHQFIDLYWKFTGSALKQWGGPFYVYGQKRAENVVTTFLGTYVLKRLWSNWTMDKVNEN